MNIEDAVFDAMQTGNTDRLFLGMAITGHPTFCCPETGKGLDIDKSFMIEITDTHGESAHFGPYDKSVYTSKGIENACDWFLLLYEGQTGGKSLPSSIALREIKG